MNIWLGDIKQEIDSFADQQINIVCLGLERALGWKRERDRNRETEISSNRQRHTWIYDKRYKARDRLFASQKIKIVCLVLKRAFGWKRDREREISFRLKGKQTAPENDRYREKDTIKIERKNSQNKTKEKKI